jgi:hypothetical protein
MESEMALQVRIRNADYFHTFMGEKTSGIGNSSCIRYRHAPTGRRLLYRGDLLKLKARDANTDVYDPCLQVGA